MTLAAKYVARQPQRTSPQAAMLLGWARDDPMADHTGERMQRELELQRWHKWQPALLAAKGLNDKLVATAGAPWQPCWAAAIGHSVKGWDGAARFGARL